MIQFIFHLIKTYGVPDQFIFYGYSSYPTTSGTAILNFVRNLCVIIPIFARYFAFFYIIKDDFSKHKEVLEGSFDQSDLDIIQHSGTGNKDIDEYLN